MDTFVDTALDPTKTYCYLDVDVSGARGAFRRATEFVKSSSIKYGLSSDNVLALGGREVLSLPQTYASDFEWSSKGRMQAKPQKVTRIVVELYSDDSPLACENFKALCSGGRGKAKGSGVPLHYRGSKLHRIIPGFILQGGDFVFGNGSGGAPQCDRRHVVFGQVISGLEVLELVEKRHLAACGDRERGSVGGAEGGVAGVAADAAAAVAAGAAAAAGAGTEEPAVSLAITSCGEWRPGMPVQGYWDADDAFVSTAS